ncbi:MAG TPA: hypothetical protein VHO03_09555 [Ignavibacteriales bacterium]|nr:hypothetical protein [Ignavibacteriales bacterium]
MQSKLICEEFERKLWQFMDREMPDVEIVFWERHLHGCTICSTRLQEAGETLSLYETIPMEDLEEETFNRMVSKAVKKNRFNRAVSKLLDSLFETTSAGFIRKFAFGGLAFSAVVIILFFMYKPENLHPGKTPSPVEVRSSPPAESKGNSIAAAGNNDDASGLGTGWGKSEVVPVKYEWNDKSTSSAIRQMKRSITGIRIKKERYIRLDGFTLQAIALRRKMQWLTADIDKSAM